MSAGAPCSICLASAELAAYEIGPLPCPAEPLRVDFVEGCLEARSGEHHELGMVGRRRLTGGKGRQEERHLARRRPPRWSRQFGRRFVGEYHCHTVYAAWYRTTHNGRSSNFGVRSGQSASKIGMSSRGSSGSVAEGRLAVRTGYIYPPCDGPSTAEGARLGAAASVPVPFQRFAGRAMLLAEQTYERKKRSDQDLSLPFFLSG